MRPGRVGPRGNPGGASRVASAGLGRAHEVHVGVEESAPRGLLPAAPRRPGARAGETAGGVPARRPSPAPSRQASDAHRSEAQRLEALSARISSLGSRPPSRSGAGSLSALSGNGWGCGRERKGFPTGQTPACGKDWDGQRPVGKSWGFNGTARGAESRRLAPEIGAGRQAPLGCTPSCEQ